MFWIILIGLFVFAVLFECGVFRKKTLCRHCGKSIKGIQQKLLGKGKGRFILCEDCCGKIHPQILSHAETKWSYAQYQEYLKWEEETKEERQQINPTEVYGYTNTIKIDTERRLFSIGNGKDDMVYRFEDIIDQDISFEPEKVKKGIFSPKIKGDEYVAIEMACPSVYVKEILNRGVVYKASEEGIIHTRYVYELPEKFLDMIILFLECRLTFINEGIQHNILPENNEVQKALALFMFDSLDEITEDKLREQRKALLKVFHPDNHEKSVENAKKINASYELLRGLVSKTTVF